MNKQLQYTGKYIEHFQFEDDSRDYDREKYFHELCEMLDKHFVRNIRSAKFTFFHCNQRIITIIEPILKNLTSLEFCIHGNSEGFKLDLDSFQIMCPNLTKLKLKSGGELIGCDRCWPSLKNVTLDYYNRLSTPRICLFLKRNPQITTLELEVGGKIPQVIATYLRNVQKLHIQSKYPYIITADGIHPLTTLCHLLELKIVLNGLDDIESALSCLKEFKTLRELKIKVIPDPIRVAKDIFKQSVITLA